MSPSRIGRKFSPGLQEKIKNASQSNSELRKRLLNNGFDWNLKEFQQYWRWVSKVQQGYSKKVKSGIVKTRSDKQVYRYNQVFWSRFYELKNPKIRQFCQEKLWDHWKPRLEKIRELTGGNFHRMASWRNQYLIGCGFNRQAVVYILEKVYSHESRENLFQELSERIKNSPYEIDFLFPKNWKEGDWEIDRKNCWKPEPENMFFIINKILNVFEMNWKKLQGDKDEKLLGWRRTERNTQFGYRKVEIEEDEESEEEFEEEQELFEYYRKKKEKMRQAELKDNMSIKERLEREETEKKERKERKMEKLKNKPIKEGEKSETEEKETVERLNAKKKRIEKAEKRMEKKQRKIESEKERIVGEIIDLSGSNSTKDQRSTESLNYSENLDISSFMSSFLEQSDDNLDAISISSGEFESSSKSDYKMFETIKVPADSKSIKIKECSVVIDKNLKPKVAAGNKGMLKRSIMDSKGETSTTKQYSGDSLEKCSVVLTAKENQIEKTLKIGVGSKENGSQENSGFKSMNQGSRKHRLDSENLSVVPLKKIKLN